MDIYLETALWTTIVSKERVIFENPVALVNHFLVIFESDHW